MEVPNSPLRESLFNSGKSVNSRLPSTSTYFLSSGLPRLWGDMPSGRKTGPRQAAVLRSLASQGRGLLMRSRTNETTLDPNQSTPLTGGNSRIQITIYRPEFKHTSLFANCEKKMGTENCCSSISTSTFSFPSKLSRPPRPSASIFPTRPGKSKIAEIFPRL